MKNLFNKLNELNIQGWDVKMWWPGSNGWDVLKDANDNILGRIKPHPNGYLARWENHGEEVLPTIEDARRWVEDRVDGKISESLNEGANRPGYKEMQNVCAHCQHFDEGDRYSGDLDRCTIYDSKPPYQKLSTEYVREYGICNLFKRW